MIPEPGTVTVTQVDGNGTWVVAIAGEHDAFTVPPLEARTARVWAACSLAIIDLTDTTFMDAAVLAWLLRARAAAGSAAVAVVERQGGVVGRIFDITGVRDILDCHPSHASARLGSWAGMLAPAPGSVSAPSSRRHARTSPRARRA